MICMCVYDKEYIDVMIWDFPENYGFSKKKNKKNTEIKFQMHML